MIEIIFSTILLSFAGIFLIWIFADEQCDKWEKNIVEKSLKERICKDE